MTVDSILGQDYTSKEEIVVAHIFVKKFIVFVVKWLHWMADNPHTVSLRYSSDPGSESASSIVKGGQESGIR